MNEFQNACIQKCKGVIKSFDPNVRVEFEKRGRKEMYYYTSISIVSHKLELFIDKDQAQYIIDEEIDWISEKWDYDSEAKLVQDFAERLRKTIRSLQSESIE